MALDERVVEVIAYLGPAANPPHRYGSGCRVAGRTVLTAAHVVAGAQEVSIRGPDKVEHVALLDQAFVGHPQGPGVDLAPDLALLTIPGGPEVPALPLVAVDRASHDDAALEHCQAVGYPEFAERGTGDEVRDTAQADGSIPVLAQLVSGLLTLQVTSSPQPLPPTGPLAGSPWSGMSGAPVLVYGRLVGVVTEHAVRAGPSAITATPLTALDRDPAHPSWGPGVSNAADWWARLGVPGQDGSTLTRVPFRRTAEAAAARARWMTRHQIDRREIHQPNRDSFIEPLGLREWARYVDTRSWRSYVLLRVTMLHDFMQRRPQLRSSAPILAEFGPEASYPSLKQALTRLPLDQWQSTLHTMANEASPERRAEPGSHSNREEFAKASADIRWLLRQVSNPEFRHCFCLLGSWGSGRTRLLTEMARRAESSGHYALFVDFRPQTPLRESLLAGAADLFGRTFADLLELDRFLDETMVANLSILLDDLDQEARRRAGFTRELQDLLEESTVATRLRWALTADEARFDSLLDAGRPEFWMHYGFPARESVRTAGWLNVDLANAEEQLGLQLLDGIASAADKADLAEIRRDADTFRYEISVLSTPLNAWLRAEVEDEVAHTPSRLVDLHAHQFVNAYWKLRRGTLSADSGEAAVLDQSVTLLARRYAEAADTCAPVSGMVDFLEARAAAPALQDTREARRVLRLLSEAGLLTWWLDGDPEVDIQQEMVEPRFEAFWGYRIARPLWADAAKAEDVRSAFFAAIEPWKRRARNEDPLAVAVCQFALGLLPWDNAARKTTKDLWLRWAGRSDLPKTPLWLAAAAGSRKAQGALARWLSTENYEAKTKRELFTLVRLLGSSSVNTWRAQHRLAHAQRHYRALGKAGLGSYLAYVMSTVLSDPVLCGDQNYVSVLCTLCGSEQADAGETAAKVAVRAGVRAFQDNTPALLNHTIKFFKRSSDHLGKKDFPIGSRPGSARADAGAGAGAGAGALDGDRAYFFWQHLAREIPSQLIAHSGLKAFTRLGEAGWYGAAHRGVARHVAARMQTEANAALGSRYRHYRNDEVVVDYLEIVRNLVAGEALDLPEVEQREIAFFLIRHTTVTHGRRGVRVDSWFHPPLRELCADGRIRDRVPWLQPTCEANGLAP
jgi:hypothetical protein